MQHESAEKPYAPDWSWKLRLFFSADLVGSTAFKARQPPGSISPDWAPTFRDFFRDFPAFVESSYDELRDHPACKHRISPWKFSGDEILFRVELADHRETVTHIAAFKHAVRTFPELWAGKDVPLKLKATGWLAGFPVTNTEILLTGGDGYASLDFIGPSIDLGFRIARFADPRRFVLSADLTLMLLDAIETVETGRRFFRVAFHGRETLKGVIGNEPYPIFWLDVRDGEEDLEEKLLGINRKCEHDDVRDYLRQFITKTPHLARPFISGDRSEKYGTVPPEFEKLREKMQAEESERGYLEGGEAERPIAGQQRDLPEPKLPTHPQSTSPKPKRRRR